MDELKLTGNCLKGSRPILSFDKVSILKKILKKQTCVSRFLFRCLLCL